MTQIFDIMHFLFGLLWMKSLIQSVSNFCYYIIMLCQGYTVTNVLVFRTWP